MKLLNRNRTEPEALEESLERPPADRAPEPRPDHDEPRLADPTPTGRRGYVAIVRGALKAFSNDHMTSIAAALAYYAFLAIPSVLLVAAGLFGIFAGPNAVATVIGKLHGIVPSQAISLVDGSLRNLTRHKNTGITVLAVGAVLAVWSLTGAMQNVMWAVNVAYEREEQRGFIRRRLTALWMVVFALIGFAVTFGVVVLGPHLSTWVGHELHATTAVKIAWYVAEWPIAVAGLLFAFAGLMYYGPHVEHRRWRFLSFGAVVALVIWLATSAAFAFYTSRFGSYNKTWGSLAAVVVMLTWLWLSAVALLLGAEVDAEADRSR